MRETIRVFTSNVRGLVCNWESATSFNWEDYDLLAFNEVWSIQDFENLSVSGFEIKTIKLRNVNRGGGTIIFGRENLKTSALCTPFIEGVIESTGIAIGNVIFIQVYRPPSGNKDDFVSELTGFLDNLGDKKILIGGDFNLNNLVNNNWINQICENYGLEAKIKIPTRVESGTCIDNYLSNIKGTYSVSNISIADHLAITALIDITSVVYSKKPNFTYREMKEKNWLGFKNDLVNLTTDGKDIESKWEKFLVDIKDSVEKNFPKRISKHQHTFIMSQGLLKSRDKKNSLLRKYKAGLIEKSIYINYNKCYRKLIKVEQFKTFKGKLEEAGTNGKLKWKVLREGLLINNHFETIEEINNNNKVLTDTVEIAGAFKEHFETCAFNLASGLPPGKDTVEALPLGVNWGFQETNELELVAIIKSLKTKNSCGNDQLSNRMIKMEKYAFAKLLKPLINESLRAGIFPHVLKSAKVIPVFKKGDKTNLNNYRPISLLPVLSKVYEKVLNKQLNVVINNGYIDDNQFGFREGFSTEDATLKFVNKIEEDIRLGKHVATVYVDVSKAFDSCDHGLLINKIKRTGLNNKGINLMTSYLKNREQGITVNNIEGGKYTSNIGVPQGSILGPTLFKIYIMDLHCHTDLFCMKFADDSSFEGSSNTKDELESLMNKEMKKVDQWFKNNRLTIHPGKSKFLIHSKDKLINIKIGDSLINRCGYGLQEESVSLLGLMIDENLDWKVHINKVTKKIAKGNYLLWRHNKKLTLQAKKQIYESFIRCHILYCLSVWGGAKLTVLNSLNKVLKKSWRKIGKFKQHTLNRLQALKILTLKDELSLQELKILWRWENKTIPNSLSNIIVEKRDRLRGRRFVKNRNSKIGSINNRLTNSANLNIKDVMTYKTKKSMVECYKLKYQESYAFTCRNRNCFLCSVNLVI